MKTMPAYLRVASIPTIHTRLSALLALVIVVMPLLGYGIFLQTSLSGRVDGALRALSFELEEVISGQPDYWALRGERLQSIFEKLVVPDESVRVFDKNGELVFQTGGEDKWHFFHRRQSLYAFGLPAGQVDVGLNVATELWHALLLLCASLLLAGFIWWGPLGKLPLAALADADRRLRQKANYQKALLDNFPFMVWLKDTDGRILAANKRYAQQCGRESTDLLEGKTEIELWPADLAAKYPAENRAVLTSGSAQTTEDLGGINGCPAWFETYRSPVSVDEEVVGTVGYSRDITAFKQAQEQITLAASVFANAREGIMITTLDGVIVDVNDSFSRITGYSRDEVIGKNPRLLKSGRQAKDFYTRMWGDLAGKGHWYGEVWNRRKNGEVFAEMQTITTVRDAQGNSEHFVSLFSDITAVKEHQLQLEHIAHFDALTNLPNRVLLSDRLKQGMKQAERSGRLLAVAYLDLDGFKAINDLHEHESGDLLLIALAGRMKSTLRDCDTLARVGGDEFVAVLEDVPDIAACVPMLTRLLAVVAQPVHVGNLLLQVTSSIGVTFHPQVEEVQADQLIRQADQAMYHAKLAGKNRFHIFDTEQDRSVRGHHESLDHIRKALLKNQFVLHYQPKVNMRSGQVVGVEALIRWQHPSRGLLAPALFLPVVENHPLAIEIGEWVMHAALTQMDLWHQAGLDMMVSINIGARQLQQENFVPRMREILAMHSRVNPAHLQLELLETSALQNLAHVSQVIEDCRLLGVSFALDDFGTGYSSLTYLKRLSVTQLKIDQSFVRDMLADPDDLVILQGVIGLAAAFQCEVIAEGVETAAHGAALLGLGCELAQGYGIARPMPANQLPGWVSGWRLDGAWGFQTQAEVVTASMPM
jgi:diguanylate cyclase (GGDEF)-like protein/PAS domain S-box-containing protein